MGTAAVNKDKALGIKVMMSEARLLIAVVDDDKSVDKALGRLLRALGLHAETFVSGSEFLKWLQNNAPHCVVLDQDMPQMDGFPENFWPARELPTGLCSPGWNNKRILVMFRRFVDQTKCRQALRCRRSRHRSTRF